MPVSQWNAGVNLVAFLVLLNELRLQLHFSQIQHCLHPLEHDDARGNKQHEHGHDWVHLFFVHEPKE